MEIKHRGAVCRVHQLGSPAQRLYDAIEPLPLQLQTIRRFIPRPDFPPVPEIATRGAIVTECPPDQDWTSAAAVARDRIIAALGRAEAAMQHGQVRPDERTNKEMQADRRRDENERPAV